MQLKSCDTHLHPDVVLVLSLGGVGAVRRRHDEPLVDYGAAAEHPVGVPGADKGHLPRVLVLVGVDTSDNEVQVSARGSTLESTLTICRDSWLIYYKILPTGYFTYSEMTKKTYQKTVQKLRAR